MKTTIKNLFFLLLLIPSLAFAHENCIYNGKYTKEKKIKKEFTVSANAELMVANSYGNVNIVSWNENRTVIEVHVKTSGNNEEKVQDKLDDIDVFFDASNSAVSAKTSFNKDGGRSWWNSWKNNNVNIEVNYEIKVPATNAINISNDYGNIILNRIEGNARISCDYGKLILGELLGDENSLNFDYTKNSTIGFMKGGRINADYSSFSLEKGGNIELNADYSKSEFGDIKDLNYVCDYGSVHTDSSGNVTGRGDYLSAKLGTVNGDVNVNADFGSLRIDELSSTAGDVRIRSDYTGIKIGYNSEYNFTFNITLEYAGLSGKDNLTINKQRIQSSDKYYEGYYGNANASNTMNIDSEYGGVTLTRL